MQAELVEPQDPRRDSSRLRQQLDVPCVPRSFAEHVVSWLYGPQPLRWWPTADSTDERKREEWLASHVVMDFAQARVDSKDEQHAMFSVFSAMCFQGVVRDAHGDVVPAGDYLGVAEDRKDAVAAALMPRFLAAGLELVTALHARHGLWRGPVFGLFRAAVECGALKPAEALDMSRLRATNRLESPTLTGGAPYSTLPDWFFLRRVGFLEDFLQVLDAEPAETVGRVAGVLMSEFAKGEFWVRPLDETVFQQDRVRALLRAYCERLEDRLRAREDDVELLDAYFETIRLLRRRSSDAIPEPHRAAASKIAGRALGRLRRAAREGGVSCAAVATPIGRAAYTGALRTIAAADGLGPALRSGAMLLRDLREPAVDADLRWFRKPPLPDPPERWRWLVKTLFEAVHTAGATEQHDDPGLERARSEFAGHLIDRLLPARGRDDAAQLTEPDETWRICCIRAVRELAVNPDGRGHRVLHKAGANDPSPAVRRAATNAYDEVRRATGATGDVSPRRRIMAALWWLRQAHRATLIGDVSPSGARSTRDVEPSITKEQLEKNA